MKHINVFFLVAVASFALASCADTYESAYFYSKPDDVTQAESLNSFDVLKSYVNRSANPNFKLGAGATVSDFLEKETEYSLRYTNFDELTPNSAMMYGATVADDGTMNFSEVKNFVTLAEEAGLSIYGHTLCWHSQQNDTYLNNLIAPIPGDTTSNVITVANFELDDIGDTYEMTGNGAATVVADPAGVNGNVLNIGGPASYSYPKIHITLSDGLVLGNCTEMIMDFYATSSTGLYGSGIRMAINDVSNAFVYGSPSSFGCPNASWGKGLIVLDFSSLKLTDDQKALTEFDLIVGSGTGSGNYYIDNIKIGWEIITASQERTDEDKKDILIAALNSWISGMMENCNGYVTAWDAVNEPMSDNSNYMLRSAVNESSTVGNFYWQDYLGDNYVRYVIKYARQYFKENGGNESALKLFINDYGLETYGNEKCNRLIQAISQWEEDGTVIDGISSQMHVTYSCDAAQQAKNEEGVVGMLELLAATTKIIKISELDMDIVDENGSTITLSNATTAQQQTMAEYYNFIVRKYFDIIPEAQRYGITQWTLNDTSLKSGLWDSDYNRKYTYAGFANALDGKQLSDIK